MQCQQLTGEGVTLLRELLRVDTSNPPGGETPAAELLARYLQSHGVHCELVARHPARANLVARLPGRRPGSPSLMLLGHTDVVPADATQWRHPPFGGVLDDDGYVWGRGALDMKNEVVSRAVAMAVLARENTPLDGDLVLVVAADEEDGTNDVGMSWLVQERPDIATDYVINEGAAERLTLADGRTIVTLSVGEKAAAEMRVTAIGTPGHASMPHGHPRAVPVLAELVRRLAAYRPRRRLLPATERLLETLVGSIGGDIDGALDRVAALHPALVDRIMPLLCTTIAPTRLHASQALNVLPGRASVDCDCRILPGTTVEELHGELVDALGIDLPYELELVDPPVGGTISPLHSPLLDTCRSFLAEHDPEAVLLPLICTGFTDSHYVRCAFGSTALGFWPSRITPHEIRDSSVHGYDERVHSDDLGYATLFHLHACRELLGAPAPGRG
jgi:acetylornithine deacetylase/succinyl-diaminopimelate desuccinylase-like protein